MTHAVYAPPSHLATPRPIWERVLRKDACAYCPLRPWRKLRGTLDHIHPRSDGGNNNTGNIVGACPACNNEKGSRSLLLFLLHRAGEGS